MGRTDFMEKLDAFMEKELIHSQFAWWEWDIRINRVICNDLKVTMLGYDPKDFTDVGYQAFTELLHPMDFERTMQAMRDHLENRAPLYQIDYRILKKDGTYTWYMDRGYAIDRDENNKPLRLRGIVVNLGLEMEEKAKDAGYLSQIRQRLPSPASGAEHIVTLCSVCQRFRIEELLWVRVPHEFDQAFPERISHGICPDCISTLYPEFD
ncbi:PAS domain-containing protein [Desulfobotulus alkaliphilus]|uniref:PAS domain-containing protein n=1 Tax=Desulfobotulus alkaliphilus TaxID=622671 RepID=A0A562R1G2_9BACT|nr:PAS domain-containing protein [Desulfobotulus alkaliphilus]TWI62663.1 PAS domain-containing protein [Desulfobotulus alkaliphilus]